MDTDITIALDVEYRLGQELVVQDRLLSHWSDRTDRRYKPGHGCHFDDP
jgi:hypothetical protein